MITASDIIIMVESIDEANPDLSKAKAEIEKIKAKLVALKVKIMKEKEMGKPKEFLDKLSSEWANLQDKIVDVWKSYDSKYGTRYAAAYG